MAQEAAERDRRLNARPKHFPTRADIPGAPNSHELAAVQDTLADAFGGMAQQIAAAQQTVSRNLQALIGSSVVTVVQQIQQQYASLFDSLALRAFQQIAIDQQRMLAALQEPIRQAAQAASQALANLPDYNLLARLAETARLALREPDPDHPRYHLLRSLSQEQYYLCLALQSADSYLRPETLADETGLDVDTTQRYLDLLVATGLTQQVSVATTPEDKLVYVTAYRGLQPGDDAREAMLERLGPAENTT